MPPWYADNKFVQFKYSNDRSLSELDKQKILLWIKKGVPTETKLSIENIKNEKKINSDYKKVILTIDYTITKNTDEYRAFVFKNPINKDFILKSVQINPGSNNIHHIAFLQDPTNFSDSLQNHSVGKGFEYNGIHATSPYAKIIYGWAPGAQPLNFSSNNGVKIKANNFFLVEMHYDGIEKGKEIKTEIEIGYFLPEELNFISEVYLDVLLHSGEGCLQNPPFIIEKNTQKVFYMKTVLEKSISILGLSPHMHTAGSSFKVYAVKPNNDTINLLNIDKWNPYWQEVYYPEEPIYLEKGSILYAEASYNNTPSNFNLKLPLKEFKFGPSNKDEMMHCAFLYTEEADNLYTFTTSSKFNLQILFVFVIVIIVLVIALKGFYSNR